MIYSHPDFEARYQAARDDVIRGVSNHLREEMGAAVDVIAAIMRDDTNRPQDRLAAAKSVLAFGGQYVETNDILERIDKLERGADDDG